MNPLMLLGFIPSIIKLVSLATIVGTIGWYIMDYNDAKVEVANMKWERSRYENTIQVLRANVSLNQSTITQLDTALGKRMGDITAICKVVADIQASKDANDNKPVGGIISRTLEALHIIDKKD